MKKESLIIRRDNVNVLRDFLAALFVLFLVGYCSFSDVRVIYERSFKDYDKEIKKYLKDNDLTYIETKKNIGYADWRDSPFDKPPIIDVQVQINDQSYSKTKYKIVIASRNGKKYKVWVKIISRFYSDIEIVFAERLITK
ncbi:MAG: hypothetical protein EAZ08_07540 [Cytophagales bacterium]|nr:MAG: hypothetical protein EAZ08_07540 [Cytophagales bacterium]